jgi:two-component system chemotaxis response regulator CheB
MKKIRVLIVDDSLFMRAAIAKTLTTAGFEVVGQAKDGKDGLAQIQQLKPDVVTMDFNMPGMNGADTVRAMMQARPTPVVMFSAHTKQGAKETFDAPRGRSTSSRSPRARSPWTSRRSPTI